jgi:hypothetical protein
MANQPFKSTQQKKEKTSSKDGLVESTQKKRLLDLTEMSEHTECFATQVLTRHTWSVFTDFLLLLCILDGWAVIVSHRCTHRKGSWS